MHNDYSQQDVDESMRKGLWAAITCTVLVASLVIASPIEIPDVYPGAPLQASAHKVVPIATASAQVAQGSSLYHDGPFVTDTGNSPDPQPQ